MKFKAIAAAFREDKEIIVVTEPTGNQWLYNGVAIYSIAGMPKMRPVDVLKIFDVKEDKLDEWYQREEEMDIIIQHFCSNEEINDEDALEMLTAELVWNGEKYLFLRCKGEVYAVNEKYLKPLFGCSQYLRLFKKKSYDGSFTAIVCYNGLELEAIIIPAALSDSIRSEMTEIISNLVIEVNRPMISDKDDSNVDSESEQETLE